jgi:hypothetical protein
MCWQSFHHKRSDFPNLSVEGATQKGKSRVKNGRRPDLDNRYFRSTNEANFARYLQFHRVIWAYEPKTFWFPGAHTGPRCYTPDFYLPALEVWCEVKGWMDTRSQAKLDRLRMTYPDMKVVVVGEGLFERAERQRLCQVIPHWECRHTALQAGA